MLKITVFNESASADDILEQVMIDGIGGIAGGRVSVREKLGMVAALAENVNERAIRARATIDHPETELAFIYDESRFTHAEARDLVRAAYDSTL